MQKGSNMTGVRKVLRATVPNAYGEVITRC
jgi:hypothetical protein